MRESHPLLLCTRKIESVGRVSAPRLKSSGTIGSHSSPLHLPQVALSSSQPIAWFLSRLIIMNIDVSVELLILMGKKKKNNPVPI